MALEKKIGEEIVLRWQAGEGAMRCCLPKSTGLFVSAVVEFKKTLTFVYVRQTTELLFLVRNLLEALIGLKDEGWHPWVRPYISLCGDETLLHLCLRSVCPVLAGLTQIICCHMRLKA
ncbi:hypothetical protein AMECASPLE_035829 [Ameca splendens]|uniref:Uncharacterized protein n=1 Tax=Ameca splendens TaxID=208324 RepID=A0ABV0Z656_9TELE